MAGGSHHNGNKQVLDDRVNAVVCHSLCNDIENYQKNPNIKQAQSTIMNDHCHFR